MRCHATLVSALCALAFLCVYTAFAQAQPSTIPLTKQDRQFIERYLGKDVVGEPVEAPLIDDVGAYLQLTDGDAWSYKFVHGKQKGTTQQAQFQHLVRKDGSEGWKISAGGKLALYGQMDGGDFNCHSTEDGGQGVISRYEPPEPILHANMKPGDSKRMKVNVHVFDLSRPDHESHKGSLDVVFTYVGAYKVTVPAGTYDAILHKTTYEGKVGPADVKDVQYTFHAKGVGLVAKIEKSDVSAFLVYQDHSKVAALRLGTAP